MRLSQLLPRAVLDAVDRVRTRRFLALTGPPTAEYVRRHGLRVRHGPFAGMDYLPGLEASSGDLVAKLVGSYERELHRVIEEWSRQPPTHLIDVGCAEGYYAVGLALAVPGADMRAFDIDATARARCASLAALNGLSERVSVGGECDHATLRAFPAEGVALLSDCEGAEKALLDPSAVPALRSWRMLVELHDFIDSSISETITTRFADTHEVDIIEGESRTHDRPPELDFMSTRQRAAVLGERRPGPMRWAHLRPRHEGPLSA
jgi:hypothetical protein